MTTENGPAIAELAHRLDGTPHLSVFVGGCTLDAAEVVCADVELPTALVLDALDRLVDHSPLHVVDGGDDDGGEHRYLLLETVRQFADRALGADDRDRVRARHGAHYAAVATELADLPTTMAVFEHIEALLRRRRIRLQGWDRPTAHPHRLDAGLRRGHTFGTSQFSEYRLLDPAVTPVPAAQRQ